MTRSEFTDQFVSATDGLSLDTIASACCASRYTVERWLMGKSAPHTLGRESVLIAVGQLPRQN